mgnify:CR=1 FL=1
MFEIAEFLKENRLIIVNEWAERLHSEGGKDYLNRPIEELLRTTSDAFDAYCDIIIFNDYKRIDKFINKIAKKRLREGFSLSEIQKAFGLFAYIVIDSLSNNPCALSVNELAVVVKQIIECQSYAINNFSERFQQMYTDDVVEYNKRLEAAERLKEIVNMANTVAHELRNPLTIVGGFSRRLVNSLEKEREQLSIVVNAVEELEKNLAKIIDLKNKPGD